MKNLTALLSRIRHIIRKKPKTSGFVGVLALISVYFFFFSGGNTQVETLIVHKGEFLQQVSVSGKVVAAQDVDLGFSQSGRVAHAYVDIGDTVYSGELLAEIENGDLRATVLQKQAALESQQAKLRSLKEGTRPEDIAIAQSTVDGDVATLAQANQAVVNAISDAYAKSDDAVRNKFDQFISNPRTNNPQLIFTTNASQLAINLLTERVLLEQALSDWKADVSKLTATSDVGSAALRAQGKLALVASLLADASAVLSQASPSSTVSQSTLSTYVSDITTARTTINTSIASLTSALTTQKSATAALDGARKNLELEKAGTTQSDIDAQAAQVKVAEADVENAQAQLQKTRIVAPFSGVVTKMDSKVGQIVSPNTPEISLISTGVFQIESFVPEINIALLKIGNEATTTLDAYGPTVPFGAKVVSIDPAETIDNGVSTYRAVLEFSKQDARIKPGMTANVVITTAKKSDVISVPQGIVTTRGGKKYVSVMEGGASVEKEVVTGDISSLGDIEILSGLSDGDEVVLTIAK